MPSKELQFTNLHQHSCYSNVWWMLDAAWTVSQIVQQCKTVGYKSACLTDHWAVWWHIRLIRECKENGLKPICWCEMYVVDDIQVLKDVRDKVKLKESDTILTDENQEYSEERKFQARIKNHFNVLAMNQQGLEDLWELVTYSNLEWMYFKPSVDWKMLYEKRQNLMFWTACEVWPLWRTLDKFYHQLNQQIRLITPELEEPLDTLNENLAILKKDIKTLRWELKELEKSNKLTEDITNEYYIKIKDKKDEMYELEEEFNTLKETIHQQHQEEIQQLTDTVYQEAKNALREKLSFLYWLFEDHLYVEIIAVPEKRARWKYVLIYQVAKEMWIPLVATCDSHYPRKEDSVLQDLLYVGNLYRSDKDVRFDDVNRSRYYPELFYIHSSQEIYDRFVETFPEFEESDICDMINNSIRIEERIQYVHEPEVPAVAYIDDELTTDWRHVNLYSKVYSLLIDGWKFRGLDKLPLEKQRQYQDRVKREFEVILNKGYIDYFMIMRDIMDFCDKWRPFVENFDRWYQINGHKFESLSKDNLKQQLQQSWMFDFREPIGTWIARWSAWGSLVAYLLRITNIDPMPGGLLFERFIDYTRGDVYYHLNFDSYTKDQFLLEFPTEDLQRLNELEWRYWKLLSIDRIIQFCQQNPYYNKLQVLREKWLLNHNQPFSREKEYFFTLFDKFTNKQIWQSYTNSSNSILAWMLWITTQEPTGDYVVRLTDIPDIDSDFEDIRRDEVYTYLQNKYGYENSCRIATYTILKAPSTVDFLSKIFDCSKFDIVKIKDLIDEYCNENKIVELKQSQVDDCFNDPRLFSYIQKYPFLKYVKPLMWQIVATWMHAAGIIVHNNKMSKYWALMKNGDQSVISWDSIEAESLWLMKLDILWLNTVTNLKSINKLVSTRHHWDHHWQRIPDVFKDPKTLELIKRCDMRGLFQLEEKIMLHVSNQIKPDSFEEVVLILAWGRPGPLEDTLEYAEIKHWLKEPYYYDNEKYKAITESSKWKVIYQEDLMKICKELCGYDVSGVNKIRKIVSKVQRDKMKALEPEFIWRLKEYSWFSDELAHKLWLSLVNFWAYAFNKCLAIDMLVTEAEEEDNIDSKTIQDRSEGTKDSINCNNQQYILEQNKIQDLYTRFHLWETWIQLLNQNEHTGELEVDYITDVMESWIKDIYEIELEDGNKVQSSKDHKFKTTNGWKRLEDITEDDYLLVN